jgi:uridine kinase
LSKITSIFAHSFYAIEALGIIDFKNNDFYAKCRLYMNTLVIGIAGGSGSGKTTLTRRLVEEFGDYITILGHDEYYRRHDNMSYEERSHLNYDHPAAFETDLMCEHLRLLKQGIAVDCPVYDYTIHNRSDKTVRVKPNLVIIIEGILIFASEELCSLMDIKVFIEADADLRLIRRLIRDTEERARTMQSVLSQYLNTVKPMHELYVEPSRKNADLVIPMWRENPVALDMLIARVRSHILKNTG